MIGEGLFRSSLIFPYIPSSICRELHCQYIPVETDNNPSLRPHSKGSTTLFPTLSVITVGTTLTTLNGSSLSLRTVGLLAPTD